MNARSEKPHHLLAAIAAVVLFPACDSTGQSAPKPESRSSAFAPKKAIQVPPALLAMYAPLPTVMAGDATQVTDAKVALGQKLFFDERLSKNHDFSCNSCHDLARAGVDGRAVALGHAKQHGARNVPTVYNAAGQFAQFWDGRAATVEDVVKYHILSPLEMAMPGEADVARLVSSVPGYADEFAKAFPDDSAPRTINGVSQAIGAFLRKLLTPARWDRFLQGDEPALTDAEKSGLVVFTEVGCASCHLGPYLGGQLFQKLGAAKPWPSTSDLGRFGVTKNEADRMMFKSPPLRNVEKTAPYYHDGGEMSLEKVNRTMAEYQLGKSLDDEQAALITGFLIALTGEPSKALTTKPELPPSGPTTRRPREGRAAPAPCPSVSWTR